MKPISLHPQNPHYFLFRDRPAVLITSGEHYGAVLNLDFDYVPYLDELRANGLNLTRAFTGVYAEDAKAFNISHNTLAPAPGRYVCPWARSATPGFANGGNRFDLDAWDEAYFRRLKDFVAEAGRRGIVVELTLFCPYYEESMWAISPLKAGNNVNGVGDVPRTDVLTMKHPDLVAIEERMVRKVVGELNGFDNLYYEICNEPYYGGVTLDWQRHIAGVIADAEKGLPVRHMIAQNIANGAAKIEDPDPNVSLFNFHYASPPDTVGINFGLDRPIGFDETGFKGTEDAVYRREAWEFILAGGSVFDHLDYSFVAGHEKGDFVYPPSQPGGGSAALRRQLKVLSEFIDGFDFVRMKPDRAVLSGLPEGASAYALTEPGRAYAIYVHGGQPGRLSLELPAGRYRAEWIDPLTGSCLREDSVESPGGAVALDSPAAEIALRVVRG